MSADDFEAYLDGVDERISAAITPALGRAMEHVRSVAVPLTPIETGQLAGSAAVTALGDEAELYYPGPYARNQHYTLSFHHNHGQALYLEQPMITEAATVLKMIADDLGKVF